MLATLMFLAKLSLHEPSQVALARTRHLYSKLHDPHNSPNPRSRFNVKKKPQYRSSPSLDRKRSKPSRSNLPFDFRFSYTESSQSVRPVGLRDPKYSPFGPGRIDRKWTGVCAPAVVPKVKSVESEDPKLQKMRRKWREKLHGEPLTGAELKIMVEICQRRKTKLQVNLGRDGLTHNMLNVIHNHWKHAEAVRIKCLGVPTADMKNVCTQLEDKTFGKIIHKQCGLLILYRGRNYIPKKGPKIPLLLWKPLEPVYPRLIKPTIDGLSIEETKEMRKRGLAVAALTKLGMLFVIMFFMLFIFYLFVFTNIDNLFGTASKNGYYGELVSTVRDAFLFVDLVRIDCQGFPTSDYKKIGCKLRDLVPCILVTFEKEQIVVWRGKDFKHPESGYFLSDPEAESVDKAGEHISDDSSSSQ